MRCATAPAPRLSGYDGQPRSTANCCWRLSTLLAKPLVTFSSSWRRRFDSPARSPLMRMALRCIGAGGLVLLVTSVVTPAALGTDAPTFSISPQDAPVDTVINVQSTTPCPGGSTVNIYVGYYTRSDAVSVTQFSVSTAPDGSWTGSFTANPGSMSGPGPASIGATCNSGRR